MRRTSWILLIGGLLLGAFFATAKANAVELYWSAPVAARDVIQKPVPTEMQVGMDVLVDSVPVKPVAYAGRSYLPVSRLGTEYEIRIWNHGPRRIAAIVSVDGLSVINGRPASEWGSGYIVDARSSIVIKGWRRDLETVNAFTFEPREKSYATRMGHPENVGVIGLLAIEEAGPRPMPLPMERTTDTARGVLKATPEVGGTGTGYGRDIESSVIYVPFTRSHKTRTIAYYYDTIDTLRRIGVPVDPWHYPNPFPGPGDFVPPPPRASR
jgi:hypothetical protein